MLCVKVSMWGTAFFVVWSQTAGGALLFSATKHLPCGIKPFCAGSRDVQAACVVHCVSCAGYKRFMGPFLERHRPSVGCLYAIHSALPKRPNCPSGIVFLLPSMGVVQHVVVPTNYQLSTVQLPTPKSHPNRFPIQTHEGQAFA